MIRLSFAKKCLLLLVSAEYVFVFFWKESFRKRCFCGAEYSLITPPESRAMRSLEAQEERRKSRRKQREKEQRFFKAEYDINIFLSVVYITIPLYGEFFKLLTKEKNVV